MKKQDYSTSFTVNVPVAEVFKNINHVSAWWTGDMEGSSQKLNDVFTVHFADIHTSTQKIIEMVPNQKIVWLVTDSALSFIPNKQEWKDTTIVFEIKEQDNQTQLRFTHIGLVPEIACYNSCSKGWDYFIEGSLFKLLTEGKGTPGIPELP